jgi:hypothetical protein
LTREVFVKKFEKPSIEPALGTSPLLLFLCIFISASTIKQNKQKLLSSKHTVKGMGF